MDWMWGGPDSREAKASHRLYRAFRRGDFWVAHGPDGAEVDGLPDREAAEAAAEQLARDAGHLV